MLPEHPDQQLEFVRQLFRRSERYEVLELIGQGGMGVVYKAIDRELDEVVALKLLKPKLSNDPAVIARFKQEIKLTRRIKHVNVARIFDLGEVGGLKYISMEYIDGLSLKDLMLSRGQLPMPLALHLFRQVLEGVAAAHDEVIVHRDIKPQNIMVSRDDKAFVLDFGIARSLESEDLFQTGVLVGSPVYMSTEQVLRKEVDHRSDVYSLGVLLYELLTGAPPFQVRTLVQAANKHVSEKPPDARLARPEVPEWLVHMIWKCMEKDPALRYSTVREMVAEIDAHARGTVPAFARVAAAPAPVVLAAAVPAPTPLPVPAASARPRPRVLVADSDPQLTKMMRAKLESLGVEVDQAPDGVTAVDRAVGGRFDLIVLGADLPRLDGFEATRILRNYAATRETPVLVLVDGGRNDQSSFAFDAGARDTLTKPLNMPALARKTRELLKL